MHAADMGASQRVTCANGAACSFPFLQGFRSLCICCTLIPEAGVVPSFCPIGRNAKSLLLPSPPFLCTKQNNSCESHVQAL
jgi:hypothetical protein